LSMSSFSSWYTSSSSSSSPYDSNNSNNNNYHAYSSQQHFSTSSSDVWSARNPRATGRQNCFYKLLGVPREVDSTELKKSYRQLVKKYHPGNVSNLGAFLFWMSVLTC
jgi:DnaJ-domain-containing protein 1